jgi:hypothetical protein
MRYAHTSFLSRTAFKRASQPVVPSTELHLNWSTRPQGNAVDLACSLVEDVDDGWSVVVDYGVVLFLGFFLSHGSAFDDSWAGSVAAVR